MCVQSEVQTGTQSRSISCLMRSSGWVVPDSNCDAASRPVAHQSCRPSRCIK
jgi:hypothetical protein